MEILILGISLNVIIILSLSSLNIYIKYEFFLVFSIYKKIIFRFIIFEKYLKFEI